MSFHSDNLPMRLPLLAGTFDPSVKVGRIYFPKTGTYDGFMNV